jgi:hypothetical protein
VKEKHQLTSQHLIKHTHPFLMPVTRSQQHLPRHHPLYVTKADQQKINEKLLTVRLTQLAGAKPRKITCPCGNPDHIPMHPKILTCRTSVRFEHIGRWYQLVSKLVSDLCLSLTLISSSVFGSRWIPAVSMSSVVTDNLLTERLSMTPRFVMLWRSDKPSTQRRQFLCSRHESVFH